jgi:hypothetical protein
MTLVMWLIIGRGDRMGRGDRPGSLRRGGGGRDWRTRWAIVVELKNEKEGWVHRP